MCKWRLNLQVVCGFQLGEYRLERESCLLFSLCVCGARNKQTRFIFFLNYAQVQLYLCCRDLQVGVGSCTVSINRDVFSSGPFAVRRPLSPTGGTPTASLCSQLCRCQNACQWDPTAGGLWRPAPLQAIGSQSQPVVVGSVQMTGCGCVPMELSVGTANCVSLILTRHENCVFF